MAACFLPFACKRLQNLAPQKHSFIFVKFDQSRRISAPFRDQTDLKVETIGSQNGTGAQGDTLMKGQKRFIKSAIAASKADAPAMPWTRGARRVAFIAKRNGEDLAQAA